MIDEVLFSTSENGVATILLNRPKALNSLNFNMVDAIGEKLKSWEMDNDIKCVIIKGAGERGLCAGGDIKTLYNAQDSTEKIEQTYEFFSKEYQTDLAIANFPKPIIAVLDGIVMGGGVGLTYGADIKIVTERTTWAMPETSIGFFPDVGAAYFLNKAPGMIGRYLGLTGSQVKASDLLFINAASHYMSFETIGHFLNKLEDVDLSGGTIERTLQALLVDYSTTPTNEGDIFLNQKEINSYFDYPTVEAIVDSLEKNSSAFSKKTYEVLLSKSPVSLKVTLNQLIDGEQKSLEACLMTDLILAKNFMKHPDFFEGVRSVVIDKDFTPNYQYGTLAAVSNQLVNDFFTPE